MSSSQSRSAQQLAEVLAKLASSSTTQAAAQGGIERIAESFEAEVGAILLDGEVVASVGFPSDRVPLAALTEVAEHGKREISIPGVGRCNAVVVPIPSDPFGTMILARSGDDFFDREEVSLIRSMASILATALNMLTVLAGRRQVEAALAEARDEAFEASRLKSQILANASHEIRTPMTVIVGLTELLTDTNLDVTQAKFVEGLTKASGSLLSIINDILDFSKIEAGRLELATAEFDLGQVLEDVAALLGETARGKGLELVAYYAPTMPALMSGDSARLRQILLNLASNAVKFTTEGEVVISAAPVSTGSVPNVLTSEGTSVVRFEVRDTGIGIAPRDQWRLFEPFSQVDSTNTRRFGGTGLGLAICKQLTEAMGGHIGVESALGEGSLFWVEIPFALTSVSRAPGPILTPTDRTRARVLVVDDNPTMRSVLAELIAAWGIEVETASEGLDALRRLERAVADGAAFDVAVLDRFMPGMGGLELSRRVRARRSLDATSLVLVGSTSAVDDEGATVAGIKSCLTKPVRQSHLRSALAAAIRRLSPVDGGDNGRDGARPTRPALGIRSV